MKYKLLLILISIIVSFSSFGRENDFDANNYNSLKEFYQRNLNSLTPIEGIYHVSATLICNEKPIGELTEFDIFVIESSSYDSVYDILYLGYSDPFDKSSLPSEIINDNPGACIHAGYILQDGSSNRYIFRFCPHGIKNEVAYQEFILDIGASNYKVDFGSISSSSYNYMNIPNKFKNKKVALTFNVTKRFPL